MLWPVYFASKSEVSNSRKSQKKPRTFEVSDGGVHQFSSVSHAGLSISNRTVTFKQFYFSVITINHLRYFPHWTVIKVGLGSGLSRPPSLLSPPTPSLFFGLWAVGGQHLCSQDHKPLEPLTDSLPSIVLIMRNWAEKLDQHWEQDTSLSENVQMWAWCQIKMSPSMWEIVRLWRSIVMFIVWFSKKWSKPIP